MTCYNFQCCFTMKCKCKLWCPENNKAWDECKLRLFLTAAWRYARWCHSTVKPTTYLVQFVVEIRLVLPSLQAGRYVPKRHVRVLGLVEHQSVTGSVPNRLGEILGVVEILVDVRLQSVSALKTDEKRNLLWRTYFVKYTIRRILKE